MFITVQSTGDVMRCAALSIHGDRGDRRGQSKRPNQTEGDWTEVGTVHSVPCSV